MPGRRRRATPSPCKRPIRAIRSWQTIAQQILDIVQAVLAPYKLSEEDAIHAIRSLRSIVHGFVSLEVAGGFGMPVDLDASFHWLINLFVTGLERDEVQK